MFVKDQFSLSLSNELKLDKKLTIKKDIIIDRKSKYTLVWYFLEDEKDIKVFLKELKKDKYFFNATHNSYAYRIKQGNWIIIEWKNDDWETWAWMCILREIQRVNWVNMLIIITRYFWGIKLQTDRFKNVIDACKIFFKDI